MFDSENNGAIEVEREQNPGAEDFQTLLVSSKTYDISGRLLEVDEAVPVIPFPWTRKSRIILLGQIERDAEIIVSSDPVEAEVIAAIPGSLMRPRKT